MISLTIPEPWEFNEDVAGVFDSHVRQSVPSYDSRFSLFKEIFCRWRTGPVRVLDIGTGTGAVLNLLETVLNKDDYFIGIDNSAAMLSIAKQQVRDTIAHEFILDDIVSAEIPTWDVCFLAYTLSFIRAEERISLLSRIRSASASRSLFFFADKVKYEYPSIVDAIRGRHLLFKYSQGIKAADAEAKTRSLQSVMAPWVLQEYIDAIESAGWKDPQIIQADTAFFGIVVFVN